MAAEIDRCNAARRDRFGSDLADLSPADKTEVFRSAEAETTTFSPGVWGTAVGEQGPVGFYHQLKPMARWGYFSSEEIGMNHLNYDPIPGAYRGGGPLDEGGRIGVCDWEFSATVARRGFFSLIRHCPFFLAKKDQKPKAIFVAIRSAPHQNLNRLNSP